MIQEINIEERRESVSFFFTLKEEPFPSFSLSFTSSSSSSSSSLHWMIQETNILSFSLKKKSLSSLSLSLSLSLSHHLFFFFFFFVIFLARLIQLGFLVERRRYRRRILKRERKAFLSSSLERKRYQSDRFSMGENVFSQA